MFSESLLIADRNTVKLMIDELRQDNAEKDLKLKEKDSTIAEQSSKLAEKDLEIARLLAKIEQIENGAK